MIELPWDPELDSPATLAIIGAGPIGIEAAIYARFLGYFVSIFDTRRVAHRMLDWHHRKLACPVSACTSPLGHAAIKSQNPEYVLPHPDTIWTGKEYAELYLLPLAKTDLLFDDIHFLSPVTSISRLKTFRFEEIDPQDRCEDQFRLLVEGRHRGNWASRADIVLDCRGAFERTAGMGPGGGLAIDEQTHSDSFLKHSPLDRKFESKMLSGKHVGLVGGSDRACQFVHEYVDWHAENSASRLTWLLPCDARELRPYVAATLKRIEASGNPEVQTYSILGVEKIAKSEEERWTVQLLLEDETTVDFHCDTLASFPYPRETDPWPELECAKFATMEQSSSESSDSSVNTWPFVTCEPSYYRLLSDGLGWDESRQCWNAGAGIARGLEQVRRVFSLIVGRETLDLHQVMADNLAEGRV